MLFSQLLISVLVLCSASGQSMWYAEWAHHHLVWKSNGHPQHVVTEMLRNYTLYNISVGAVNVDSGWSTGFNNFVFDTSLFPSPKSLIDEVHSNGQKIVLWVTSMINTDSSNYAVAVENNYVFDLTINWWHGNGRLLDFGNPAAVAWFEQQIDDNLFSVYGCTDGWKVDGVDPYILELENASWPWKRYADDYYGFFLNYTRSRCGNESLILSRPCDCMPPGGIGHTGVCPLHVPYAPRNAVFMGWVGDQDSTFLGLNVAYGNMMASAQAGYISFGSDTGGYRGNGPSFVAKDLFLRWAAMNSMMPVLETGGDNRHCPWEFDMDTVVKYRNLVNFHHSIVPYLYANGLRLAQQETGSLVTPHPAGGHFLGPSCYAFPVLDQNATEIVVPLPNSTFGWYQFETGAYFPGGREILFNASELDALPFFAEAGSAIATYDVTDHVSVGGKAAAFPSPTTPLLFHFYVAPQSTGVQHFVVRDTAYLGIERVEVKVFNDPKTSTATLHASQVVWARSTDHRRGLRYCIFSYSAPVCGDMESS